VSAVYFFDTSALVKRYVNEAGSTWVRAITDPAALNDIHVARITGAEALAAVTARQRRGDILPPDAARFIADFRHDFTHQYLPIEVTSAVVAHAMTLVESHPLKGYDAVQLATALAVSGHLAALGAATPRGAVTSSSFMLTFVTADNTLDRAAIAEGLVVENPHLHP
jgi:predicted nucleic acid-binding protein